MHFRSIITIMESMDTTPTTLDAVISELETVFSEGTAKSAGPSGGDGEVRDGGLGGGRGARQGR